MYVIGNLAKLEHLDDVKITDDQRAMSRAHFNAYSINTPFHFNEPNDNNMTPITKDDTKTVRCFGKLMAKRDISKFDRL